MVVPPVKTPLIPHFAKWGNCVANLYSCQPLIEKTESNTGKKVEKVKADSIYYSKENIEKLKEKEIDGNNVISFPKILYYLILSKNACSITLIGAFLPVKSSNCFAA